MISAIEILEQSRPLGVLRVFNQVVREVLRLPLYKGWFDYLYVPFTYFSNSKTQKPTEIFFSFLPEMFKNSYSLPSSEFSLSSSHCSTKFSPTHQRVSLRLYLENSRQVAFFLVTLISQRLKGKSLCHHTFVTFTSLTPCKLALLNLSKGEWLCSHVSGLVRGHGP